MSIQKRITISLVALYSAFLISCSGDDSDGGVDQETVDELLSGDTVTIDGFTFDTQRFNIILPELEASAERTQVSGIISSNQTWTKANSPYEITSEVQVDSSSTLTIEPGVQVYGCCLTIVGTLSAVGTANDPIEFIGTNIEGFGFHNPDPGDGSFFTIEYARFYEGTPFGGDASGGSYSLKNSKFAGSLPYSINRPNFNSEISGNIFVNSSPFKVQLSGEGTMTIENNVFFFNQVSGNQVFGFTISDSDNDQSATIVNNSFYNYSESESFSFYAIRYEKGTSGLAVDDNFWGVTTTAEIDELLLDRSVDLENEGFITYSTFLNQPHVSSPDAQIYLEGFE